MNASENETRILITGANGFVGKQLITHLQAETDGSPTRITAIVPPEQVAGWRESPAGSVLLEVVGVDMSDAEAVTDLILRTRPTQIYHLTANSLQQSERNSETDQNMDFAADVQATRNLLEAASRLSPFPRVLLAGDGCVYGSVDPERPAREEDPIGPLWRYGAYVDSRIEIETVAKAYRALAIMGRTFMTAGPEQSSQYTISGYARQLARIKLGLEPPQLTVGRLEVQQDVLDVRDVVRAYCLLMAQGECGEAYNISTGKPLSMRTIVERLCLTGGAAISFVQDTTRSHSSEIACSTGDTLRTWAAIGWQPRRTLDETLNDLFVHWLQTETLLETENGNANNS